MQLSDAPKKIPLPFAADGGRNVIPQDSQILVTPGAASLTDGFPPLTRTPIAAGGVPPAGLDMNGVLYLVSAISQWQNAGAGFVYDNAFTTNTNVGGYPKGATVLRTDGQGYWLNTEDDNEVDPEGAGAVAAGWVPFYTYGASAVTMTNANVTLSALQYGRPVIAITGLLTTSLNLIFPDNIVGNWTILNNTTGSFTITAKTASGSGVVVTTVQNIVSDGTNIYSINTPADTSFTTGDVKETYKTVADSGWIMQQDGTIGSAASGAGYANANASALYTLLWNNVTNTYAPVTGGRGGSAAADFAANKPLQLPLTLGRARGIAGSGSGLTARTLGQNLGDENLQSHTHTVTDPTHTHTTTGIAPSTPGGGLSTATGSPANTGNAPTVNAASTGLTVNTSGTGTGGNMQPTSFVNIMIKL